MIKNGGMEGITRPGGWTRDTFTGQEWGEIFVPEGWVTWWKEGLPVPHDPNNHDGYGRPEMQVIQKVPPFLDPPRIRSGDWALKFFTFYRIHDAGLYQQVAVTPGQKLRFTGYAHAWSSIDDNPKTSNIDGDGWKNFTFTVGIDPSGGTDPWSDRVVWGEGAHIYNQYAQIPAVEVTALRETVTVFVRSYVLWPFKHCDAYMDDFTLEVIEESVPPGTVPCYMREAYDKVQFVAPQNCTLERWLEIAREAYEQRRSVMFSVDDALVYQPGQNVTAYLYDVPVAEHEDYNMFRDEFYPDAVLNFVGDSGTIPDPPSYTGPVVETGSKLYPHAIGEGGTYDVLQRMVQEGHPLPYCKVLATNPSEVLAVRNLKTLSPSTQFVCRLMSVPGSGVNIEGPDFSMQPQTYMNALLPTMRAYPEVTYWELWNEQDPPGIEGHVQMAHFASECAKITEREGFKLALLSYSMGIPEPEEWQAIWDQTDLFETIRDGEHILSLHAYGRTANSGDLENLLLRHRWLYDNILEPNNCVVPMILTEYSITETAPGVGITDWTNDALMAEFAKMDAYFAEKYYNLGAMVYTFGILQHYNMNERWRPFTDLLLSVADRQNALPPDSGDGELPDYEVLLFKQCDDLWKNKPLGKSIYTMCNSGCAVTSGAMYGSQIDKTTDPGKLVDWLNTNGGFTSDGLLYWSKVAQYYGFQFVDYYTWRQIGQAADMTVVRECLARGPAIIQVDYDPSDDDIDSHFVLALHEVDDDLEFADPITGTVRSLRNTYWKGTLADSIKALVDYRMPTPEPVATLLGFNDHPGSTGTASQWMLAENLKGLVVRPIFLGGSAGVLDFSAAEAAGQRVIVNLRYSWSTDMGGAGTLPKPDTQEWTQFINASIATINGSRGVWGWEIANEFNNIREDPQSYQLTPLDVSRTYNAIRAGVSGKRLAVGALDPFNATKGDPRTWLSQVYSTISGCEFVTVHGYIRGPDASLVGSTAKFADYPLQWQYLNYPLCCTELLKSLPVGYQSLPVYVTEFNHLWKTVEGDWGWVNDVRTSQVVEAAFDAAENSQFTGLALYRWAGDEWTVENNWYVKQAAEGLIP